MNNIKLIIKRLERLQMLLEEEDRHQFAVDAWNAIQLLKKTDEQCEFYNSISNVCERKEQEGKMDAYVLICMLSTAFPNITCEKCREAIERLVNAGYHITGLDSVMPERTKTWA